VQRATNKDRTLHEGGGEAMTTTQEDPVKAYAEKARKITFIKVDSEGAESQETDSGWELEPPEIGKPYVVYLSKGRAIKTTDVIGMKMEGDDLIIETNNSVYRVQYHQKTRGEQT
jgi:hypothetical protein